MQTRQVQFLPWRETNLTKKYSTKENSTPRAVPTRVTVDSSIARGGTDIDTRIRTQMIQDIAHKNVWHARNRASILGIIISVAGVPAVGSIYVNLSSDVAVSHPTTRHDRNRVQIVVDTVEVPVDLYERRKVASRQFDWSSSTHRVLTFESNQFAHAGLPTLGVP
jgi:hypothetical protein